jgi:hypothetical protein
LLAAPEGADLDPFLGLWTWTPPLNTSGQSFEIRVEVRDDALAPLRAETSFQVRVRQVQPELPAASAAMTAEGFHFTFQAEPGLRFAIEASDDLVHWTELDSVTTDGNGVGSFTDPSVTDVPHRYYRIRWID